MIPLLNRQQTSQMKIIRHLMQLKMVTLRMSHNGAHVGGGKDVGSAGGAESCRNEELCAGTSGWSGAGH